MTQFRSRLSRSATKNRFAQDAEDAATRERTIQAKIDKRDKGQGSGMEIRFRAQLR
jgi:hypothetical protein